MDRSSQAGLWWTGKQSGKPAPFNLKSLRAVLFDWAGTTIDYGSRAPVEVFREVFHQVGVQVSEPEAREPMGQAKVDHIRAMLSAPRISQAWTEKFCRPPCDDDVTELYERFLPLQWKVLSEHSDVIPGIPQTVDAMRKLGIRIGSTTGYTRALMDVVEPLAAEQGYAPQVTVCSDEVAAGRPAPWQVFRAAERLDVYPMSAIAVVDDSIAGISAGRTAGCWAIAVAQSGNALGLSRSQCDKLAPSELQAQLKQIAQKFLDQGAHMVARSVADLEQLL